MTLIAKSLVDYEHRVLVTGSRLWGEYPADFATLPLDVQVQIRTRVAREISVLEVALRECVLANAGGGHTVKVAQGGAAGADRRARTIAEALQVPVEEFPAEWGLFGRSAGMKRNVKMLDEFCPDVVLAFAADLAVSRGTRGCVREALKRKLPGYHFDSVHTARRILKL